MADITYICISDLHLGEPTSLLTDTPATSGGDGTTADALRDAFSEALLQTIDALVRETSQAAAPGIVLLGDIFDMSLGTPRASIRTFDALLKSLAAKGARERIGPFIFLPGNHDHELWTVSRFEHMLGGDPADDSYVHTTPAFAAPDTQPRAALIDKILRDNGFQGAATYYPNMGLMSADGARAVVLHHGHFIEPIYHAMSSLTTALEGRQGISMDAESLERLNASWIDFIWSTDGDDGRLGADINFAHDALLTGRSDISAQHDLAGLLADRLLRALPLPHTTQARSMTRTAARALIDSLVGEYGQMERFSYQQTLGADGVAGLRSYLSGTVRAQIAQERPGAKLRDLSFVFGHTHKPFEARIPLPDQPMPPAVYNTGGWDMDTPMFGTRLGASAVVIDADLNLAALRLCDVPQQDDAAPGRVRVTTADGPQADTPLTQTLRTAIGQAEDAWQRFSDAAGEAYRTKQSFIMARLEARPDRAGEKKGAA